jgi:NTE family protein
MSGERGGRRKVALVLSGGGARGAYEAGVLSHFFEQVIPRLQPGFDFDILSGTSIGAIHATFTAATSGLEPAERATRLSRTWSTMSIRDVLHLTASDLVKVPLRAMGFSTLSREGQGVFGGLVDVSPLEELVQKTIPWDQLSRNMARGAPRALCVSCTEVRSGRVTVFMDGADADISPWNHDPNAQAIAGAITDRHVRASAAIPFLFPAVSVNDRYYVDGGLRMNTPLSPALRLGADRVLVIALKHSPGLSTDHPPYPDSVITQPAFLLGKVLDALTLDQLEYELNRIDLVNSLIDQGGAVYGDGFLESINVAIRKQRGVGFRHVKTCVVRPSEDIGKLAADCHREQGGMRALGIVPELVARATRSGLPTDEADLLSYLYFDGCFTKRLIEMGREDARAAEFDVMELLSD